MNDSTIGGQRSNADRSIELEGGDARRLRAELTRQPSIGGYTLEVTGRPKRQARTACYGQRRSHGVCVFVAYETEMFMQAG